MTLVSLTKLYGFNISRQGNFETCVRLLKKVATNFCGIIVSLLRSRLGRLAFDEIPERFSSSLPPLFASGRFATFLSLAR